MKTTRQIYNQHKRIGNAIFANARKFAKLAHPETDGQDLLVHNWGNAAAKAVYKRCYARLNRTNEVYTRLYAIAEHARHSDNFRPLWCKHCQS